MTTDRKKVYFIEASPAYGNGYFLPYATGAIAAYAFADSRVLDEYELCDIVYSRVAINEALGTLRSPFLVGFSCSVWNVEYNKVLAKKLKEKYPSCTVVFGGHSVPFDASLLCECDYVDITICAGGEEPFHDLLLALKNGEPLDTVSNIFFRRSGEIMGTGVRPSCNVDYPSPYLNGIFDGIVANAPKDRCFQSVIETTRGCPYRCSYCDWDSLKTKARRFPLEKIYAEIDWSAANKIDFMLFADSNYGIYERDEEIIDYVIKVHRETGHPVRFQTCFAKDETERVYRINEKLSREGISRSATISFQSMSPVALENIGRKNMSVELFKQMMSRYNKLNIPTYSELILGMPGETLDSFKQGLATLLETGQHATVFVHNCDLLPNSIMDSPEYRQKHGVISVVSPINKYHCEINNDEILEKSTTVIGSGTMSVEDWISAGLYANCVQCFHCMGLLRCFALYLNYEKGIGYTRFYTELLQWISDNPTSTAGETYTGISALLHRFTRGEGTATYYNSRFGSVIWRHEEGAYLELISSFERFFSEIGDFLKSYNIDNDIYDNIMMYQMGILRLPGREHVSLRLDYDLHEYFSQIYLNKYIPLEKCENTLDIYDDCVTQNLADFARLAVWYGRKSGKTFNARVERNYL